MTGSTAASATAEATTAALTVHELTVAFRRRGRRARKTPVVHGVSFDLRPGRTLVLLGESGSGKSVTARALLRLHGEGAQIGGSVTLAGEELTAAPEKRMREVRGSRIGMVSQDPSGSLDPLRRVGDQIVEVLRRHGAETERSPARERAGGLLAQVGIHDPERVMHAFPFELSGGMRQRVAIAIAIGCGPQVLIADEPTTALDVTVQAQVLSVFAALKRELEMALLLVTHDVGVARVIGDDVAVMYAGRLVETGPAEQVLTAPSHPYTQALLEALPLPGVARGALRAIPGSPPAPGELAWEGACAFAPRCGLAQPACHTHRPALSSAGTARDSACDVTAAQTEGVAA